MIWDGPPQTSLPDRAVLLGGTLNNPWSMTSDGTALYIADNEKVLVWRQVPLVDGVPSDFVLGRPEDPNLRISYAHQISADAQHLAVADIFNNRILIWRLPISSGDQPPAVVLKLMKSGGKDVWFNLPGGVAIGGDRLFAVDGGHSRVLGWNRIPEQSNTPPDFVLGQQDYTGVYPTIARTGTYVPSTLAYDSSYLWVGEFKWSNRLLRFGPQP